MFADISASPVLHTHNKIIEKEALETCKLFRKDCFIALLQFTEGALNRYIDKETDMSSYFS